jgi:hypothetical protein
MLCSVYGLFSSEDGIVRYIGQTTTTLERRLTQHIWHTNAKRRARSCYQWIRQVLQSGHTVGIRLLEAECKWDEAERRWIEQYSREHPGVLVNISEGGCGYTGKRPEAVRAKYRGPKSEAHKASMRKPKSISHRANMSKSLIGNIRGRGEQNRKAVLTENDVLTIKRRLADGIGGSAIAREYGIQKGAVSKIRTGRNWAHVTLQSGPV